MNFSSLGTFSWAKESSLHVLSTCGVVCCLSDFFFLFSPCSVPSELQTTVYSYWSPVYISLIIIILFLLISILNNYFAISVIIILYHPVVWYPPSQVTCMCMYYVTEWAMNLSLNYHFQILLDMHTKISVRWAVWMVTVLLIMELLNAGIL